MKNIKNIFLGITLLFTIMTSGCWVTSEQGTVQYQTIWNAPGQIIRPESGGIWSLFVIGDEYYPVSMKSTTTEPITVQAQTKDNARLSIQVAVTYHLKNDDASIREHITQYGLDEKSRHSAFNKVLVGQITTETRNAISEYDAYTLMANQGAIQKTVFDKLKVILESQLRQEIESVQLITAPDFENDNIETAASQVVANQKLKQAADAQQEAVKVETETKRIQAMTFENPKMFELEMYRLRVEEAKAWGSHQGTLILGGNTSPLINIPNK